MVEVEGGRSERLEGVEIDTRSNGTSSGSPLFDNDVNPARQHSNNNTLQVSGNSMVN